MWFETNEQHGTVFLIERTFKSIPRFLTQPGTLANSPFLSGVNRDVAWALLRESLGANKAQEVREMGGLSRLFRKHETTMMTKHRIVLRPKLYSGQCGHGLNDKPGPVLGLLGHPCHRAVRKRGSNTEFKVPN